MNGKHGPFGKGRFSPLQIAGMIAGGTALAVVLAFVFGWVVMLLWNWLMPAIFKLPTISYWQGWGLVLLSHILLKPGYGPGGGPRGHRGPRGKRDQECWKDELKEKMDEGKTEEPGAT
ncbi:MAG: hypothetical protein JNG85_05990 [Spirochaetaceae bacterium]|nr:hypothetical protein [Spirochaetaceae bacterium]